MGVSAENARQAAPKEKEDKAKARMQTNSWPPLRTRRSSSRPRGRRSDFMDGLVDISSGTFAVIDDEVDKLLVGDPEPVEELLEPEHEEPEGFYVVFQGKATGWSQRQNGSSESPSAIRDRLGRWPLSERQPPHALGDSLVSWREPTSVVAR